MKTSQKELQVLKICVDSRIITPSACEGIIRKFEISGGNLDEIIMEVGGVDEKELLKTLAAHFQTKYVTTDRIKTAQFSDELREIVPGKLAKQYGIFPVSFDKPSRTLIIVTSDPFDINAISELERAVNVRTVKVFLARSETIKMAIGYWYDGDRDAFKATDADNLQSYQDLMNVYERTVLDENSELSTRTVKGIEKSMPPPPPQEEPPAAAAESCPPGGSLETLLDLLQIMIRLLEMERHELKGHSVQVAQSARHVAERLRLSKDETLAIAMAGAMHDLGKTGTFHLTTLNASLYDGHREAAKARAGLPSKLFESVPIPELTRRSVDSMYERYDGQGFPARRREKDIPIGARIVAVADSFNDLVSNPRNPYKKVLTSEEAMRILEEYRGNIFDPLIVDAFRLIVAGHTLRTSILAGQNSVLIVDPDKEYSTILDMQLANKGFLVDVCTGAKAAMEKVLSMKFDLILTDVAIDSMSGFDLLRAIKANEKIKDIPVVFCTASTAPENANRAFDLGAADYVVKSSPVDVLVVKIRQIMKERLEKRPAASRGVSGSLKEMDLPDLVQILGQGRKTGRLVVSAGDKEGEIHFSGGQIVNALFDDRKGESAFFQMLCLHEGFFTIDPKYVPQEKRIKGGTEALLLEGMKRMDESKKR